MIKSEQYKKYQEEQKALRKQKKEEEKKRIKEVAKEINLNYLKSDGPGKPRLYYYSPNQIGQLLRQSLLIGKSKQEIKEIYTKVTGSDVGWRSAYQKAQKYVIEKQQQQVEETVRDSLTKVKYILDEAIEKRDFNLALKAVEVLNKCLQQGNNTVQVLTTDAAIQIKFDD